MRRSSQNKFVLSVFIAIIVLLVSGCGGSTQSGASQISTTPTATIANQTATALSTDIPTEVTQPPTVTASTPTSQPTIAVNPGPAVLGADDSAFIAKYGSPAKSSTGNANNGGGEDDFKQYPNTGVYFLSVINCCLFQTPSFYHTRSSSISVNSPPLALWSYNEANAACSQFAPSDKLFQKLIKKLDASGNMVNSYVYTSEFLKNALPSSEFVDANINPLPPGTFAVTFYYLDNRVSLCDVSNGNGPSV